MSCLLIAFMNVVSFLLRSRLSLMSVVFIFSALLKDVTPV